MADSGSDDDDDKKQQDDSDDEEKPNKESVRYSSIAVGDTPIDTSAGPIDEWLPIPENMPNHPTM